jgi:hypothetical protein
MANTVSIVDAGAFVRVSESTSDGYVLFNKKVSKSNASATGRGNKHTVSGGYNARMRSRILRPEQEGLHSKYLLPLLNTEHSSSN